jgi:hypothetical protein
MKRFRWQPCAVAALFCLVMATTAQAQYYYSQPYSSGYSYGYSQPSYSYGYTPAYTYSYTPAYTYSSYSQPSYAYGSYSQPSYVGSIAYSPPSYSVSSSRLTRTYTQPTYGYNWESRTSYATYQRPATYSSGYGITQPYYFAGQGYGTMTRGVLPSGASYRTWQPPFQMR